MLITVYSWVLLIYSRRSFDSRQHIKPAIVMSRNPLSVNCAHFNFLHPVIRTKYKHIALVATLPIILFVCVLIGWPDEGDIGRARLIPSDSLPAVVNVSTPKFLTDESLSAVFPDVIPRADYPKDFFNCFPDQLLKDLNSPADLDRYRSCNRIVYNRVPKCGSRTIVRVMKILSQQLNFSVISNARYDNLSFFRNITKLVEFGEQFSQFDQSVIYSQHIHYINFTQLGIPPPLYINVVREPTERVISHFFYRKYGSANDPVQPTSNHANQTLEECVRSEDSCLPKHQVLPYFCGQTKQCRLTSRSSLQRAKRTLRSAYLVVGLTEDIPGFMHTLERMLPGFFKNAPKVFDKLASTMKNLTRTVKKPTVSAETRQAIKDLLPLEYEFYQYAKQRFYAIRDRVDALSAGPRRRRGSSSARVQTYNKKRAKPARYHV